MKISNQIILAFSIVLLLSIVDTASNYMLSLQVEQNINFLSKSQDVMRNSTRIHKTIIEMQSSYRGFLLTGDNDFLDDYHNSLKILNPLFLEQEKRVADNKTQLAILKSIEEQHSQWVSHANKLIEAKKQAIASAAPQIHTHFFEQNLKNKIGKKTNDSISKKFLAFERMEYKIRKVHSNNLIASIKQTHSFSIVLFALTIIVGIFTTIYIIWLISKRIATMVRQAENISKGNFSVIEDHRQDELTQLSDSLNVMSVILSNNISELEKRNAELDKFAYVVSHDLKAPLRGIHNVVKWIQEDHRSELSVQMAQYLDIIPERTKRMEDLINGLLDYARIRKRNVTEKTNVNELVNEIIEEIVSADFSVKISNLPEIYTEKLKLKQVFTNLISNAVKYTQQPKGGVITIGCREIPGYHEFSVSDNGMGILPEYHSKIFEIFQTLRDKDEAESTGIGLAIVKRIIDEEHCTIAVNSEIGKGSEFIFTWPVKNENGK